MERVIINSLLKQNKNHAFVKKNPQLLSVQCILSMLWYIYPLYRDTPYQMIVVSITITTMTVMEYLCQK